MKGSTMTSCGCKGTICNGIIQSRDPRKIINGVVYSLVCGHKQEQQNDLLRSVSGYPYGQANHSQR